MKTIKYPRVNKTPGYNMVPDDGKPFRCTAKWRDIYYIYGYATLGDPTGYWVFRTDDSYKVFPTGRLNDHNSILWNEAVKLWRNNKPDITLPDFLGKLYPNQE
jgi:hypothetical protein